MGVLPGTTRAASERYGRNLTYVREMATGGPGFETAIATSGPRSFLQLGFGRNVQPNRFGKASFANPVPKLYRERGNCANDVR